MKAGMRQARLDPSAPALQLLDAVVRRFEKIGRDLPRDRYLLAGQASGAAWDDEHLSVSLNSVQPGPSVSSTQQDADASQAGAVMPPRGIYEIRILRDWPILEDDGGPPSTEEITAAAVRAMQDAGEILAALYDMAAADHSDRRMRIGELQPLGPLGGLVGYSCPVTIFPMQE